jgi:protein-S-isoprenylcysteine O-methyltransferase Ste14
MPGLVPGIHASVTAKSWMAGTSPAMTMWIDAANPMPERVTHPLLRFLARTPVHTFVLMPIVVAACELIWRGGTLAFDPWGVPLLVLGYAQYRLVGQFRSQHGGGGPGVDVPPTRLVTEGPFRFTRNPMYLGHLVFMLGLAVTFRSYVALALLGLRAIWFHRRVMADEARLIERFGAEYTDYMRQVRRWVPGLG